MQESSFAHSSLVLRSSFARPSLHLRSAFALEASKANKERTKSEQRAKKQQAGSLAATDYQITQGSLDSCGAICTAVSASNVSVKSNILLGNLAIGETTTIKEVSDVIVASNEDYNYGDHISCLLVTQRINESG